mgnify:CR=1 FL=1
MIRLEVEEGIDSRLLKLIREELTIPKEDIYAISGPLDLTFLMKLYGVEGFDHSSIVRSALRIIRKG